MRIALLSLSLGLTAAFAVGLAALVYRSGRETMLETVEYMAVHALWVGIAAALFFSGAAYFRSRRQRD